MSLPKLEHPIFEAVIPSNNKKVRFRPMLVKDEKLLLMAAETEDPSDPAIYSAIKQVVNNCVIDDINVDDLALFDIEWLFLKIRIASIGNDVVVFHRDVDDNKIYKLDVDLNDAVVVFPDEVKDFIEITDKISIKMRHPDGTLYDNTEILKGDLLTNLIVACIDTIYIDDEVIVASDYSTDERTEFVNSFNRNQYEKLAIFISNQPSVRLKTSYTNSLGTEKELELVTLNDFFMLR